MLSQQWMVAQLHSLYVKIVRLPARQAACPQEHSQTESSTQAKCINASRSNVTNYREVMDFYLVILGEYIWMFAGLGSGVVPSKVV